MKSIGVVLAGGLSRRMEGKNKSLLELGGKPLIARVAERLSTQTDKVIINANHHDAKIEVLGMPVVPDTLEGFAGPLAGILAAMRWVRQNHPKTEFIVTAATDTPFFPDDLVSRLTETAKSEEASIVLAASNGRHHPVFGLWHTAMADELETFLIKEKNRKVLLFVERYTNALCEFPLHDGLDPFFNVNTPQDYEFARNLLKSDSALGAA